MKKIRLLLASICCIIMSTTVSFANDTITTEEEYEALIRQGEKVSEAVLTNLETGEKYYSDVYRVEEKINSRNTMSNPDIKQIKYVTKAVIPNTIVGSGNGWDDTDSVYSSTTLTFKTKRLGNGETGYNYWKMGAEIDVQQSNLTISNPKYVYAWKGTKVRDDGTLVSSFYEKEKTKNTTISGNVLAEKTTDYSFYAVGSSEFQAYNETSMDITRGSKWNFKYSFSVNYDT